MRNQESDCAAPALESTGLGHDLAYLRCVSSRTFQVCVACPLGDWVPGYGSPVAAWYESPEFGRYGLCAHHDEEWRRAPLR